ncbi:metal ABC transporter substrate-binding protein [Thermocrinis jamiesonii]|uniref:metal ABC transporter substrate-binding protein n=1 Tax=Thermocrinis jamiesonii TaxID=1302351 RepID=UPI000497BD71|nr:metal ABC transporter substrate-binding protein [Thermocrinis jamiesonii]
MRFVLAFFILISLSFSKESLVATTYPIYYPLVYLAGEIYKVQVLITAKADVHHYELKPKDRKALKDAKAVFTLGLESWEKRLPVEKSKLYFLHQGIELITEGKHKDPHLWMSPRSYQKLVDNIFKALVDMDPNNRELYQKRYEEFSKKLKELDGEFGKVLSECKSRWLVSTHHSLSYLAKDYGLKAVGIKGIHAEEEPKPSEILNLIKLMKRESIKAIFVEEGYSDNVAKKLSQDTGASIYRINTSLYPTNPKDDYFSIMYRNLQSLAEGLDCRR